jgi:hypothetical protein
MVTEAITIKHNITELFKPAINLMYMLKQIHLKYRKHKNPASDVGGTT